MDHQHDTQSFRSSDLFQTLLAIPLLAASAGATFMLIPSTSQQNGSSSAMSVLPQIASEGHDQTVRRQRVVMARMESPRAKSRAADRQFGASQ